MGPGKPQINLKDSKMPSLTVIRTIVNHSNGSKQKQTIVDIWHKHQLTLYKLYDLLLANDALEGGDTIIYKEKKEIQKYHLCMICRKRAIENVKQIHCSTCTKPKIKEVSLPLDQASLISATPTLQQKRDNLKVSRSKLQATALKPKPDYSKFYKY